MDREKLCLKRSGSYIRIFWEIYQQERSSQDDHRIAVQIRKEEILKERVLHLTIASDIRRELDAAISLLEQRIADVLTGMFYEAGHRSAYANRQGTENGIPSDATELIKNELLQLKILRAKKDQSDAALVQGEIEKIRNQPGKDFHDYLAISEATKQERFKKWGSTSFRGIGAAIGAAIGGLAGTFLYPGPGSAIGMVLGASAGSLLGLVFFGLVVNYLIVCELIPLSKAFKQASQVQKIRKRQKIRERVKLFQEKLDELTCDQQTQISKVLEKMVQKQGSGIHAERLQKFHQQLFHRKARAGKIGAVAYKNALERRQEAQIDWANFSAPVRTPKTFTRPQQNGPTTAVIGMRL